MLTGTVCEAVRGACELDMESRWSGPPRQAPPELHAAITLRHEHKFKFCLDPIG